MKEIVVNEDNAVDIIEEQQQEINELNKKYRIMKENAETLAARIDKAVEYMEESLECGYHGEKLTFDKLVKKTKDILEGRE